MSTETQNTEPQEQGAGELTDALSGGETEFVASEPQKQLLSQGMLYLLLLLAVGGGGTYYMYKKQSPSAASAASAETAAAQQTIDNFLNTGPQGIKMMQEMLHNTQKIVDEFNHYPSVPQIPLEQLTTNPFRFGKADNGEVAEDDAKKKKEEEKLAAMKASQDLRLQSIMVNGKRSSAMINNKMFTEGQQIGQFVVEKINRDAVIVKSGTYRFELRMQK